MLLNTRPSVALKRKCKDLKRDPDPYKFIGFGAIDVTKPYKLRGFGAIDVTKLYKFIGFGAIDVTRPYKFIGFGAGIPPAGPK